MRKILVVLVVVLSTVACAKVKPVVVYGCMGCKALLASGLCTMMAAPPAQAVLVPECKQGEVVVIENWTEVGKGEAPRLGCEKEK